ncbi:MAG: tetratricopeptide repeat protein [Planctomycetota bacterium]|nr:tetratricopeptide repeat protein [Planctomycetota bacterium]
MSVGPEAQFNQAFALLRAGRAAEALALAQRLLPKHAGNAAVNHLLAMAHLAENRPGQAEYFAQRATELTPRDGSAWSTLGAALNALKKLPQAERAFARATELKPDNPGAWAGLGTARAMLRDNPGAREAFDRALALAPSHFDARVNAARLTLDSGRPELAGAHVRALEAAVPERDTSPAALTTRLLACTTLNYDPDCAVETIAQVHRRLGSAFARAFPARPLEARASKGSPLRVGLMSPDLRVHSCSFFVEPLLAHHDPARVELFAYHTSDLADAVTARLRALLPEGHFREVHTLSDDALTDLIRADGIDVLIDLAGCTVGHRLGVLARRAAPIQATYLGYPNTTGLPTVDYRLVDALTDPPGAADELCTESLVRLAPCFLCFVPPRDAPAPAPPDERAPITFASFNRLPKVNDRALALWSRVLHATPGSRLMLKSVGLDAPSLRDDLLARLEALGIARDRVELAPATATPAEHLALYARVHVALDTFPYNGTTTTCDTLHMGVPVVTLASPEPRHAARVGLSLLTAAGLPELVARTPDEFVSIASGLAQDRARILDYRARLRAQLAASPLGDARRFAERFFGAVLTLKRPSERETSP